MIVIRKDFPEILRDNDELFLSHLQGIIESVDELCSLQINKNGDIYYFRIAPSIPLYSNHIIKVITSYLNKLGIRCDFSKSIKSSGSILFKIEITQ